MASPFSRLLAATLMALGLTLVGCGSDSGDDTGNDSGNDTSAAEAPGAGHNDADVAFASQMIPHHAQALVMVDLTQGRTLDAEFTALTDQIRDAQAPEIETMRGWLLEWGEEVPETMRDHAHGHMDPEDLAEMEMGDMPGMASGADLARLAEAPDGEFQQLWLTMMIEHHEGAIAMAEEELEAGGYEPALELAQSIIDSQAAEIDTMRGLLDG